MDTKRVLMVLAGTMVAAAFLALWNGAEAQEKEEPQIEAAVKKLKAELDDVKKAHEELKQQFEQAVQDFKRHSHPVKWWNPKDKTSKSWDKGVFFIAYPKVGSGDSDSDARAAGGTWGVP